jgi:monoterpene epsilon-lactone hydrolase
MIMSGLEGYEVVSVDYRMPPDHPFPAALDDALAVWKALSAQTDPRRMGVFGASAGGGLTLALMLRARDEGVALPAVIAPGTFRGLPPAILTSGTRDLLLSDTVRAHRKLRQAGVPATLQVFEAMSHAQFLEPGVPEATEAFGEIAAFFDQHLGG